MGRGIFITGTDTGVGKTLVTAAIVRWLRCRGVDAVPMKPVQTGCTRDGKRLIAPDLEFCLAASNIKPGEEEMCLMAPYLYGPACSPHLAGRIAGQYPDLSRIKYCADRLLSMHQVVVTEGAGGIMVPLNETTTMLDLMRLLAYPVVLVARTRLGTINHTLLSIQALRAAGLKLLGIVFNQAEPSQPENDSVERDNPGTVARFSGAVVLGTIRHFERLDPGEAWPNLEEEMPWLHGICDEVGK
ncbi:MAG: dethiobiotin synthase [Dehalococcoidales bacterium]|nr:dethiobiotin synthase [Dehalococcoidales bacterium]